MGNICKRLWSREYPEIGMPALVCCTDEEKHRYSVQDCCHHFEKILQHDIYSMNESIQTYDLWSISEQHLVRLMRNNEILRRLATMLLSHRKAKLQPPINQKAARIISKLAMIWDQLLHMPPKPPRSGICDTVPIISLVIPCHCERVPSVQKMLHKAFRNARSPNDIQVVLVDTGMCDSPLADVSNHGWGDLTVVSYTDQGGRGPALNAGAQVATGAILVFSHADVQLPQDWDQTVVSTLERDGVCAAAFGFAVGSPRPWGIRLVEWGVSIRCAGTTPLPYGDQCLAMYANQFRYIGGFPQQSLMEDYDFITLLRERSRFLGASRERIAIMAGPPALVSSRRWYRHGVVYVTCCNFRAVRMHRQGISINDIYKFYYGTSLRPQPKSPWEETLDKILATTR